MSKDEEIKDAKLLTVYPWSNIEKHRVYRPHGGVRLKEGSLSLTSQTILRKALITNNLKRSMPKILECCMEKEWSLFITLLQCALEPCHVPKP